MARTATHTYLRTGSWATDASSAPSGTRRGRVWTPTKSSSSLAVYRCRCEPAGGTPLGCRLSVGMYRDGLQRCARWDEAGETYPDARFLAIPCFGPYYSRQQNRSGLPWGGGRPGRSEYRAERSLRNRRTLGLPKSPGCPGSAGPLATWSLDLPITWEMAIGHPQRRQGWRFTHGAPHGSPRRVEAKLPIVEFSPQRRDAPPRFLPTGRHTTPPSAFFAEATAVRIDPVVCHAPSSSSLN